MMTEKFGIDTMSFYVPENRIFISDIIEHRKKESQQLFEVLTRGQQTTQQHSMRLTNVWQDAVCIATQAAISMLSDKSINLGAIRYLISATETPVDTAKPNVAYMHGILKQLSIHFSRNMLTYQTQHACAAGSISIIQALSLIRSTSPDASALITMADISHYAVPSNAEVTQGAGAIAVLASSNPRLLEIDHTVFGVSSEDVDDFFRPVNSTTASVKGRYSMQCYILATYEALKDYAQQRQLSPEQVIDEVDYLIFHAPFKSMASAALTYILKKYFSKTHSEITTILKDKHIELASEIIQDLGNTYTAATYFSMGHLLNKQYKTLGNSICGKKMLVLSYGAGNTSIVFQACVAARAPEVIQSWNLSQQMEEYTQINFSNYKYWCGHAEPLSKLVLYDKEEENQITKLTTRRAQKLVYLDQIREDNYRIYGIQ